MRRTAALSAAVSTVVVAAIGLPVVTGGRDPSVVNIATGLIVLVSGANLIALRQTRAAGVLLELAAVAWFLPDLATTLDPLGPLLSSLSLCHVPLLGAALLIIRDGGLVARLERVAVFVAGLAALSAVTGGYQLLIPLTGVLTTAAAMSSRTPSWWWSRPATRAYLLAVVAFATALVAVPISRQIWGSSIESQLFVTYSALIAATATALVQAGPWLRRATELDVGADALASLDELLAEVTRDPDAHAVIRLSDQQWVTLDGSPTGRPEQDSSVAVMTRGGLPSAHREVVQQGLELAATNMIGRELVRQRLREVRAIRGRLVRAEDDARSDLVTELNRGPLASLQDLRHFLTANAAPPSLVSLAERNEGELAAFAVGLDPLAGHQSVGDALRLLGQQMHAEVTLDSAGEVDNTIARVLWFAAAEGLSNAVKHAPDARRGISLAGLPDRFELVVFDEGPGPGPLAENGLLGVRDRVAALSGTVAVHDTGHGTRLVVCVPRLGAPQTFPGVDT